MSAVRDELFELIGRGRARNELRREHESHIAALIRGEAQILGCRVRLEWVDPKPDFADAWAAVGGSGV